MDNTLETYRQLIQNLLIEHTKIPYAHGEIEFETVFDCHQDRYLLMLVGREQGSRVHGCLIHVDIVNGKFWVQRDGTEQGIANELALAGVPKDNIVLGFRSEKMREYGEFAVV